MGVYVIKSPKILIDGVDVSCKTNSMSLTVDCDMLDKTVFCSSGGREYIPGLINWTLDYSGFYSAGDNDVDDTTFERIGVDSLSSFLIGPTNAVTTGDLAYFGTANKATYTPLGSVGDIAPFAVTLQGEGRPCNGTIIFYQTVEDTSGYGEVHELNGLETGQQLQTILQLTNFSGAGNVIIALNASCTSGFGDGVTEVAFTTLTDEGASYISSALSSTDKKYYRVDYASSGPSSVDATIAVSENFGA
jgi:hypothetical protein